MKPVSGEGKIDKVVEFLQDRKLAIFQVNAFTRNGREELMEIISRVFMEFQLNLEFMFNIYSAIVEVIFNGLKANVKYAVYMDELRSRFKGHIPNDDISLVVYAVIKEASLREAMSRFVMPDRVKNITMKFLKLDEQERLNKPQLSENELELINEFREKIQDEDLLVHFSIGIADNNVVFSVVNDSPIMPSDLRRINNSRNVHQGLHAEGRSGEYFSPDYLDTTESAGLGIAMADEVFYDLKLNPLELFTIHSDGKQTRALLRFPRTSISM